ncbi:hypothetical protein QBC44DRAFT_28960 [Cladorrhinum sp. PSN332]|nr:hypothetical protein QBC44DRAFT_28960 [Cladorrhinum sp. PSN332]
MGGGRNVGYPTYRQHFVWLTDTGSKPPSGNDKSASSGEAAIQSSGAHDWQHVRCVPLTVGNRSGISALFCAPHSMVTFLPLIMLLRKDWQAMRHLYQQYLAGRDQVIGGSILREAYSIACRGIEHIRLDVDESIAQAVTKLVTQLVEQTLGSKQAGFNPRVRVAPIGKSAAAGVTNPEQAVVALQMPAETPAVVKAMLTMDAVCVLVSLVAYYRRIGFVTHPKVDLYKRRAAELILAADDGDFLYPDAATCNEAVNAYLKRDPRTRFVEILCYGQSASTGCHEVKARMVACLSQATPDVSVEMHRGEEWNHSRYQAAVQREDTLYVVLVPRNYLGQVEGISEGTIRGNTRLFQAIARATYETLLPRALLLQIGA